MFLSWILCFVRNLESEYQVLIAFTSINVSQESGFRGIWYLVRSTLVFKTDTLERKDKICGGKEFGFLIFH